MKKNLLRHSNGFIGINKIGKLLVAILWAYCIFSMARSLGMLFLAYTDPYFYNFDFDMNIFIEKNYTFVKAYDLFPFVIGIFLPLLIKWSFPLKLNWLILIGSIIFGYFIFRFFDAFHIRSLFFIFDNPRGNLIFHFSIFLTLVITLTLFFKSSNEEVVKINHTTILKDDMRTAK